MGIFCYGILSFHGTLGVVLDGIAGVTAGSFRFLERLVEVFFFRALHLGGTLLVLDLS